MRERRSIAMPVFSVIMLLAVICLFIWMIVKPPSLDEQLNEQAQNSDKSLEMVTEEYAGLYSIYLDIANADIQISASSDDVLRITFPQEMSLSREYDAKGGYLTIQNEGTSLPMLPFGKKETRYTIKLALPELSWLQISTETGNIQIRDIRANSLSAQTVSGDISIEHIEIIEYVMLGSESGQVEGANFYSQYIYAETDSGGVQLEHVYATEFSIYSLSGAQYLNCEMGAYVELFSQSGNIELRCAEPVEGGARTSGGNVSVYMPDAPQSVSFRTETGNVRFQTDGIAEAANSAQSSYWGQVYENRPLGPLFRVETASGNLFFY